MLSNNYKSKKPKDPLLTQVVTRKGYFSGLSFKVKKDSDIKKSNYLSSVPNISFSFDFTRVIFDYGNSANNNDKQLIESLFKNMAPGTSFRVSDGNFLIESSTTSANLSGTYAFVRLIGYAVVARPTTLTNLNTRITVYQNKFFTSVPQFSSTIPVNTDTISYTITNSLISDSKNSFINFGMYPNDTIKISGTQYNNKSFKIISVDKNSDGSESLTVGTEVTDEVNFGNSVGVELVQTGNYKFEDKEKIYDSSIGSCTFQYENNTYCFNNHTSNQCDVRASEKNILNPVWIKDGNCSVGIVSLSSSSPSVIASKRKISVARLTSAANRTISTTTNQTVTESL